jgi:hypothetical protein
MPVYWPWPIWAGSDEPYPFRDALGASLDAALALLPEWQPNV